MPRKTNLNLVQFQRPETTKAHDDLVQRHTDLFARIASRRPKMAKAIAHLVAAQARKRGID
jgi:hypothetical protein